MLGDIPQNEWREEEENRDDEQLLDDQDDEDFDAPFAILGGDAELEGSLEGIRVWMSNRRGFRLDSTFRR
jgi:hypothetical protein